MTYPDPEIEALQLAPVARSAAYALKEAHPSVRFTSGRRDKGAQAHAMATNVAMSRGWIRSTYRDTDASQACQAWVDQYAGACGIDDLTAGLLSVLCSLSDEQLGHLSRHLSGEAFDVLPVIEGADEIKATIRGLAGLDKFLDVEGGLLRWHAQFLTPPTS